MHFTVFKLYAALGLAAPMIKGFARLVGGPS